MRLLLDEMYGPRLADGLRALGHDVVAVKERDDLASASDVEVFLAAREDDRVLVTEDAKDFLSIVGRVLVEGGSFPGIVLVTNRRFPRAHPHTRGRLIVALDALIKRGGIGEGERHWLR